MNNCSAIIYSQRLNFCKGCNIFIERPVVNQGTLSKNLETVYVDYVQLSWYNLSSKVNSAPIIAKFPTKKLFQNNEVQKNKNSRQIKIKFVEEDVRYIGQKNYMPQNNNVHNVIADICRFFSTYFASRSPRSCRAVELDLISHRSFDSNAA